jgi:predicted nuclease of predicted toxin-antitoxin system
VKIWIDAQLPPNLAEWVEQTFSVPCLHVEAEGLRDADDADVFSALRKPHAVIMTKDGDFVDLVTRLGTPPQVLWIRIGNCGNEELRAFLSLTLRQALELLNQGEPVVELKRLPKA